jgi:DNA excision repair protein ERCC-4
MNKDPFIIIVDTREQTPWEFGYHDTAKRKLDTGDYSIEGFEDLLAIERKKSVSELATNLSESRFVDVLDRLSKIPHSYMVFEFDLNDIYSFPVGSDIPKKMWDKLRISGNYIIKRLIEIQLQYNIQIVFCADASNAERFTISLMKRIYERYNKQKNI